MKILVYEHVSGGGFAGQPLNESVLAEGFGMLRTLVADLKEAGHEVTVLLDGRLSKINAPIDAECTVPIFHAQDAEKFLVHCAEVNDATYVVAPETGETLESLVRLVGQTGKMTLSCEPNSIQQVSDKVVLVKTLKSLGLRTPETMAFDVSSDPAEVKKAVKSKLSYPTIFKPADGTSCGGLSLVRESSQVEGAIAKIKADSAGKRFAVEEFVNGEAASVSLLCTGTKALALTLNRQDVKLAAPESPSCYEGGVVPLKHPLRQEAFAGAEKVARAFTGLRGYIGVDLVLAEDGPCVVDVNPRLTTSYVGLSSVAGFNVAEAMINAVLKGELPAQRESVGFACFSKIVTSKPTFGAFTEASQLSGVVSPPFLLDDESKATSLVAGYGTSMDDAQRRFGEAKKRLLSIISRGG